jgi:hypothetical protein
LVNPRLLEVGADRGLPRRGKRDRAIEAVALAILVLAPRRGVVEKWNESNGSS